MQNWLNVPDKDKASIYNEIANQTGLTPYAVEKDWWVTQTIGEIFQTNLAPHLVFKGGTSLSKAWNLIERFSEDIDLAVDRSFFKMEGELSGSQVKTLRKRSFNYISEIFYPALVQKFKDAGLNLDVRLGETKDSDQDPIIIEIYYPNVIQYPEYIKPRVLVEIGCRSLREPFTVCSFSSLVGSQYPTQPFADAPIAIPTVNPERTFLEKIFLLHEEFQKPAEKIRVDRLSRHLYDVDRLMNSTHKNSVLTNKALYKEIVHHRRTITFVRDIDYAKHKPEFINPLPPQEVLADWKKDYQIMQEQMIYGESPKFEVLLENINALKAEINKLDWSLE